MWREMLVLAAEHEGGVEHVVRFVASRMDNVATVLDCYANCGWLPGRLLLREMLIHLVNTTTSRGARQWAFSVLREYTLHWLSRIRAARAGGSGWDWGHAMILGDMVTDMCRLGQSSHKEYEYANMKATLLSAPGVVLPFHVPRFDPNWLQ